MQLIGALVRIWASPSLMDICCTFDFTIPKSYECPGWNVWFVQYIVQSCQLIWNVQIVFFYFLSSFFSHSLPLFELFTTWLHSDCLCFSPSLRVHKESFTHTHTPALYSNTHPHISIYKRCLLFVEFRSRSDRPQGMLQSFKYII